MLCIVIDVWNVMSRGVGAMLTFMVMRRPGIEPGTPGGRGVAIKISAPKILSHPTEMNAEDSFICTHTNRSIINDWPFEIRLILFHQIREFMCFLQEGLS